MVAATKDTRETQPRLWRHVSGTGKLATWSIASPAHIAGRVQPIWGKGPLSGCGKFMLGMDWRASATARTRAGPGPVQASPAFPSISQFLYGTVCMYVQVCPGTEYSQMRCRTGLMRYDRSLALTLGVMSSILLFRQSACITSSVMSCPACCEPETGAQRSRILGAPANTRRAGGAPF